MNKRTSKFNSLWPGDAIWWHRNGLKLVQAMACCLTAPTHYLNQWLLIITQVLWYSHEGNFVGKCQHYDDVIMTTIASQITSLTVVYSIVYSDADERKHQSSASLAFVWGIHRDRWIPRTKDQSRGKCFHLMTSSWSYLSLIWAWKLST